MDRCEEVLLRDGLLLSFSSGGVVVRRGSVLVRDGVIEAVGEYSELRAGARDPQVVDCRGKVIAPGFVNAHTHLAMTLLRGVADEYSTLDWLGVVWPIERRLRREDVYYGALLGAVESVLSGTTCVADHYFHEEEAVRAARAVGLRVVASESMLDVDGLCDSREGMRRTLELWKKYARDPMVRVAFAPHSVYSVRKDVLEEVAGLAEELGVDVHIHASESAEEVEESLRRYGATPIEYLAKLGLTSRRLLVAHANVLTDGDVEVIRRRGVRVVHVPTTAMKHGLGLCPVARLRERGVIVGLGTDGPCSNNNLDMIEEMRTAVLAQRLFSRNPKALSAQEALRMATLESARALGLRCVGNLAAGYRADLIVINARGIRLAPLHNVPSHIVFSMSHSDIELVMVEGRIVAERGRALLVDAEEVVRRVQRAFEDLMERCGLEPSLDSEPSRAREQLVPA